MAELVLKVFPPLRGSKERWFRNRFLIFLTGALGFIPWIR
jgi:hypothetical protein